MSSLLAAAGPSAYWYLSRGTGAVALVLLTGSVVLGILGSLRYSGGPRWPRFAIDTLHRDISLLVLAVLAVHIITSVLDSFAPIRLVDAVIPFAGTYRPLWLGLGALAFDLLLALAITSLARRRLGYRTWRAIHWLAYASWPVALLHGLGTGSDTKVWWMLGLTIACAAAVLIAVIIRISRGFTDSEGMRVPATIAVLVGGAAVAIFALAGPLQRGWARRAGTPVTLLGSAFHPVGARVRTAARVTPTSSSLKLPFSASLLGTAKQIQEPGGALIDLTLRLGGGAHGRLRVRMAGAPIDSGGLSMTGSQVDLLAEGLPSVMQGQIVSLQGQQFLARVADSSGAELDLRANLNIDSSSGRVTGSLRASQRGGGG